MALEDIGCRAVVEGMQQFRASIDEMNRKTKDYADTTALKMMFAQDKVEKFAKSLGTTSTKLGLSMAAIGAAITGTMALSVRAFAQEDAGVQRLSVALKNVGVEYDKVKGSLEANISTMQAKTGIADDQQREALSQLVAITGDYNESLKLLPLAMDMSKGAGMDMVTTAEVIGRVSEGNTTILSRYGLQLKEGATATEALGALQAKYGGQAEAYGQTVSGQIENIKNNISDLSETIGQNLAPIIQGLANTVNKIVVGFKNWIEAHPELARVLTIITAGIGGLLVVIGGLILALPTLTTLVMGFGTVLQIAMGPVGWITLAIGLLTAAGIALWRNWDKVVSFFKVAWENIKIAFAYAVKFIVNTVLFPFIEYWSKIIGFITQGVGKLVGVFNQQLGASIESLAEKIKNARGEISDWADNLITDSQINKAEMQAEKLAEAMGKKASEVLRRNSSTSGIGNVISEEMQKKLDDFADTAKKIGDAFSYSLTPAGRLGLTLEDIIQYLIQNGHTVDELKQKYVELGEDANNWAKAFNLNLEEVAFNLEEFYDAAKKAAEDLVDSQKDALDEQARAEDKAHQKRLDNLQEELEKTLETIDAELDAKLESYNAEINAIDKQLDALDAADKAREDSEKKAQLESQIATEYDLKKKFELNQNLDDLILNSNNEEWQEERKLALEKMIADESDAEVKAKLQEELNSYLNELDIIRQKSELENQKKTLESKIEEAQKEAEKQREIAQETYDYKVKLENEAYEKFKEDIEARKEALDLELKQTLERYEEDLKNFKATNQGKIEDTKNLVKTINAELDRLRDKTITITEIHRIITVGGGSVTAPVPVAEGGTFEPRPGGTLALLAEAGEREYAVPESKVGGFISAMFGRLSSQTLKAALPYWSKNTTDSHNVTYSVNANYSKSQSPVTLKHDLEAIQMMARS